MSIKFSPKEIKTTIEALEIAWNSHDRDGYTKEAKKIQKLMIKNFKILKMMDKKFYNKTKRYYLPMFYKK